MAALEALAKEEGVNLVSMSNKDGTGLTDVNLLINLFLLLKININIFILKKVKNTACK